MAKMAHPANKTRKPSPVSALELAKFLRQLASVYNNKKTGNPSMSVALYTLADEVANKSAPEQVSGGTLQSRFWELDLKLVDLKAVAEMIDDSGMTKSYLIKLGVERFSIPKSKMQRLNIEGIKLELRNALMHEESIGIISQEASRSGAKRVS